MEAKRYSDRTRLSDRELLGEIEHALILDPALEAWIVAATRAAPEQLEQALMGKVRGRRGPNRRDRLET